ncbi:hypothetical protein [Sulfurimonas indica]|uniref:hypothetical protein n=1 Tax=Sulfurimonas indica TaxID=2508707 RepID=UPI0012645772|nr:hypothetical protein [Sulfurimonas indica]
MINYIVDEYGNKTHAIVPIDEWLKIMHEQKISGLSVHNYDLSQSSYHIVHLRKILHLLTAMEKIPVEEWQEQFKKYFSYYHYLKSADIGLLYLLRNKDFIHLLSNYSDENAQELYSTYFISSKKKKPLSEIEFKTLHDKIFILDEAPFLLYFHDNYKYVFEVQKKIRYNAEAKRLFVYDIMEVFPIYMTSYYNITKEDAQNKLMQYLYNNKNGAKTQLQRALREADDRINHDGWKSYFFM